MATRITLDSEPGVYLAPVCYYWDSFARRGFPVAVLHNIVEVRLSSKKLSDSKVIIVSYHDFEIDSAVLLDILRSFVLEHRKEKIIVVPPPVAERARLEDYVVDYATSMDIDLWHKLIDGIFPSEESKYTLLNKNLKTIVAKSKGSLSLVRWLTYERSWVDTYVLLMALKGSDWYIQHAERAERVAKWLDTVQVSAVGLSAGDHDFAFRCVRSRFLPARIQEEVLATCRIIVNRLLTEIELKEIVSVKDWIPSHIDRSLLEMIARAVPEGVVDIKGDELVLNGFF